MQTNSFILAGVWLLVLMFMIIILYFIISAPLEIIFDGFDDAEGDHSDEMDSFLPHIRNALNMAFAIMVAVPITYIIFWVFKRDPEWEYRRP